MADSSATTSSTICRPLRKPKKKQRGARRRWRMKKRPAGRGGRKATGSCKLLFFFVSKACDKDSPRWQEMRRGAGARCRVRWGDVVRPERQRGRRGGVRKRSSRFFFFLYFLIKASPFFGDRQGRTNGHGRKGGRARVGGQKKEARTRASGAERQTREQKKVVGDDQGAKTKKGGDRAGGWREGRLEKEK